MAVPLNAGFGLATSLLGVRLDPYPSYNFWVEIEGLITGGFSECTGLQVETDVKYYEEGGLNDYKHSFRGRTNYPSLILTHGITLIDTLWRWHQDVLQGTAERKNGTIYLLNRARIPVLWWNFKGALPVKWTGPDLHAENSRVAVEKVELVHQGLSRPTAAGALAGFGAELIS
jgi:phage tail-like protein